MAASLSGELRALGQARRNFRVPLSQLLHEEESRRLLSGESGGSGTEIALWRWRGELAKRQFRMVALKLRAALALFRNLRGGFPGKLAELVPDILPQVPLDPYTGQALRYKQDGEKWQLRSIGPDAKFDSREPTPMQLQGHFWEGTRHVFVPDPDSDSGYSSKPCDFDYVIVSTLDSNINVRKKKYPRADAEWARLHPEEIQSSGPMDRPPGLGRE